MAIALLACSGGALADGGSACDLGPSWPQNQSRFPPGPPDAGATANEKGKIPPGQIVPPGPDVPENIRALSGRWYGWMCGKRHCAASIEVVSLTAHGGFMRHRIAATDYADMWPLDMKATIQGDELVGQWKGIWAKIRLRPDGNIDIMRWWDANPQWTRTGVLSRVQ